MFFYQAMQNTANRLLMFYGRQVNLRRVDETNYNVDTGEITDGTELDYTAYAHPSQYDINEIDGVSIKKGDIRLLMYSVTEPAVGDVATVDAKNYRVLDVQKVSAQGQNIVYRVQIRI